LVNQIRENGDELVDQKVVEKVLRSLPRKFDAIVVVIAKSKDLTKYSMDELVGSLKNYEDRLKGMTIPHWSMHSKHKLHLAEAEEEEIQVSEEEEEKEIIFKEKKESTRPRRKEKSKFQLKGKQLQSSISKV
jgi:hypothetical protein